MQFDFLRCDFCTLGYCALSNLHSLKGRYVALDLLQRRQRAEVGREGMYLATGAAVVSPLPPGEGFTAGRAVEAV